MKAQLMKNPHISVISPVFRGEKMLDELVSRVSAAVGSITNDYEIILVNDASPDQSWAEICRICDLHKKVIGVNLSRNFGQHYAITAGLSYATGEWIVVMDCDLQDRPEEIPHLYSKALEGFDSVFAQRVIRHDTFFKKLSSKLFYLLFSYLTETSQDASIANFGIYHRKVVDAVLSMGDSMRYFPAQVQWVGFRKGVLPVDHSERAEGKSSYSFNKLFRLALDTMISFSDKPLRIMVKFGSLIVLLSILAGLYFFVKWLCGGVVVLGYTSIMISVWFLAGVVVSLLGVVGLYQGKMFDKIKDRPIFIVSETRNVQ